MNKVWLIEEQHKGAMGPSNNSMWLTHAMALTHVDKLARSEAAFLSADLSVETRWRRTKHQPVTANSVHDMILVEVRAADDVWFTRMKYFISEWEIQGDAVTALAEIGCQTTAPEPSTGGVSADEPG